MTFRWGHLLMPHLVAGVRVMAHSLASTFSGKTEEPR
jgi:hypothetical protein